MNLKLPSRYEGLNESYRGRLEPNSELLGLVKSAYKSMKIVGGIRFLPIFGESGSGKSCAAREIGSHLPETKVILLERGEIGCSSDLMNRIKRERRRMQPNELLIPVIDQYEERVSSRAVVHTDFIEKIAILDRTGLKDIPTLFIWLTTSKGFQKDLVNSTTRNTRMLVKDNFRILGPPQEKWPQIINETFSFHNHETSLADFQVIDQDLKDISQTAYTIGAALQSVADGIVEKMEVLQDLSNYRVILIWPVSDSLRNQRVLQFSRPREGYKLNWDAWQSELNHENEDCCHLKN